MKNSILKKIILPIFFVIITIGSVGYAVYQSNVKMNDSSKWINHTEQVINLSENTLTLVKDMESGVRGFMIIKDSEYLEPMIFAKKVVYKNIADLKELTKDKISQNIFLDSLEVYIKKRIAFLDMVVAMRNSVGMATILSSISVSEGKNQSNQIRFYVSKIQAKEYELLRERKLINEKSVTLFNWFLGGMFLLMTIVSSLFLIIYYRNLLQTHDKIIQAAELTIINNELKISEAKYLKLNDDLEQIVVERTAKLESSNKELESFSYSVSHDLRAPIRAINGYTKILEEDYGNKLDEDGVTVLASIITNSKKMGHLIDDLLAFSKLGRKAISGSEINMQEMVTTLCDETAKDNPDRLIEFTIHPLTSIYGDTSLINQVWINLIGNAVKYSKYKPKTIIEIGCYQKDDQTVYFIKDNGAGFDMKYYNKLFGVFQRLHGQDEFEGTGIGLAIVHKVVTKHNGIVWAESVVNEGASFYFSLPNAKIILPEFTS